MNSIKEKEVQYSDNIRTFCIPNEKDVLLNFLNTLIIEEFRFPFKDVTKAVRNEIMPHFIRLKENIRIIVETNYIDKVYRDCYYNYYASKLHTYKRECIKLSLFEENGSDVDLESFKDPARKEMLKEAYRGFIVLRPTLPQIIGRSAVSPKALKKNAFEINVTYISSTAMGLKFSVQAFPYSSQDIEMISCAETMLWALMEYYGNKYPEYTPLLPSQIINALKINAVERQLPTSGLSIEKVSYMLKTCGFGPKLYSHDEFKNDFFTLLSCYVESGIPVVVALDNKEECEKNKALSPVGHAMLCIGREKVTSAMIRDLQGEHEDCIDIFDWDRIKQRFIFIDDNCPAYQQASLEEPTLHYSSELWKKCRITHFIVPLHKKIYLDAYMVKRFAVNFLKENFVPFKTELKEVSVRSFLCSTRSYKQYAALSDMDKRLKDLVLDKKMPKFVWINELSNKDLWIGQRACGLIVLDATETCSLDSRPLIFALYNGTLIEYEQEKGLCKTSIEQDAHGKNDFEMFQRNLKCL